MLPFTLLYHLILFISNLFPTNQLLFLLFLELRRQKEQIRDIEAEVDVIDSNLKRAEKLLINFTRRMVRKSQPEIILHFTFALISMSLLIDSLLLCSLRSAYYFIFYAGHS